jgi:TPR repeat protein
LRSSEPGWYAFGASVLLAATATVAHAGPTAFIKPDDNATLEVRKHIDSGRCKSAIDELKPGLKVRQPDLLLLAGSLYEEGICVATDWNKAVAMYQLADEAGHPAAAARLIAGYAKAGRDHGMALWWAARRNDQGRYPALCIPRADPANAEAFNTELEQMPAQLFRGCVYLVGVSTELYSHLQFPPTAAYHGISGIVAMRFDATRGNITWSQEELVESERHPGGVRDLAKDGLENPRAIKRSLLTYMEERGKFALAQYQRPEGELDPRLVVTSKFQFKLP